jgi:hypothetical protein
MSVLTVPQFFQFLDEFPEMRPFYPSDISKDLYDVDTDDYEYNQDLLYS